MYVPDTTSVLYPEQFLREAIEKYRDLEGLKEFIDQRQMGVSEASSSYHKDTFTSDLGLTYKRDFRKGILKWLV